MDPNIQFLIEFLQASVRVAIPIVFVAIGATFSERSGVYAMGLEGYMLISCFASVAVTVATDNLFLGILAGTLAGMAEFINRGLFSRNFWSRTSIECPFHEYLRPRYYPIFAAYDMGSRNWWYAIFN